MPDLPDGVINFYYGEPHTGLFALVETRSALLPVVGTRRRARTGRSLAGLAAAATAIQREALGLRAQSGQLAPRQRFLRLVNCRPAGVEVRPQADCCDQDLCVFCWARRAVDVWRRVDRVLFPMAGRRRAAAAAYDLVLASRSYRADALSSYRDADNALDLAAVFKDRCGRTKVTGRPVQSRSYELRNLSYAGALDLILAEPVRWRSERTGRWAVGWRVAVRQLFAVERGAVVEVPGARLRRLEAPDRKAVAGAVAWLWRYPRGFLRVAGTRTPQEPRWAAKYLATRRGRRTFAAYGIFAGESGS